MREGKKEITQDVGRWTHFSCTSQFGGSGGALSIGLGGRVIAVTAVLRPRLHVECRSIRIRPWSAVVVA